MKNKLKSFFKSDGLRYFTYAMLAFGGLGIEVIYAFLLEPIIYGHPMQEFTTTECIIHWSVTIVTWLAAAWLIVRSAGKNLQFQPKGTGKAWTVWGVIMSAALIGIMAAINYADIGNLKIIHEFQRLGILKFIFQHLYYLAETVLFTLIIVFGQNALEKLFRKSNIPYGGIIVGLTWGLAHWLTKGSLWIGLGCLAVGFLFGAIYLFLGRDLRKTYIVLALAFII